MNRDELDQERPVPAVPAPERRSLERRQLPPARPRAEWRCVSCHRPIGGQVAQGRCPDCRARVARMFLAELRAGIRP